jgi:hypothetical protein
MLYNEGHKLDRIYILLLKKENGTMKKVWKVIKAIWLAIWAIALAYSYVVAVGVTTRKGFEYMLKGDRIRELKTPKDWFAYWKYVFTEPLKDCLNPLGK